MKKIAFILLLLLCSFLGRTQVAFENYSSLDKLFEQARQQKKFVFIQIESVKCDQCNDVAMKGLNSTQLKEKYAVNFICTKVKEGDVLYPSVLAKLEVKDIMGSFFFDADGNVLLKQTSTTSNSLTYIEWADKAISNGGKMGDFQALMVAYQAGDKSPVFLEKYIRALRDLDKDSDAVMEEFVGKMTIDSLRTDRLIKFVKEQGLSLNSPSYLAIHSLNNRNKTDSIWCTLPLQKRININNRISARTFSEAVRKKDRALANRISQFTRNTYNNNNQKGYYAGQQVMMRFYKAIRDTAALLTETEYFASTLMFQKIDSLKAWDDRERKELFKNQEPETKFRVTDSQYAVELNNAVWDYYLMTNDSLKLRNALKWSAHSMAMYKALTISKITENGGFMDTYAHILYKTKQYDEAIEWETKAIDAQKAAEQPTTNFEKEREKMKARKL